MPELPEVETVKNILKEMTLGKVIKSVDVLRKQTIEGNSEEFAKKLTNQKIINFERIGKFIIFHLTNENVLISHLRMEGKYFLKNEDEKITKHDLVIFHFSDNTKLVYNDTRRFGRMSLENERSYKIVPPLSNVGPDPFMLENASILYNKYKNKRIAIKTALLDQSIMSGLGNIYADEVLFESKIHPETPANLVTKKQIDLILKNSKNVLQKAVNAGGSTIKSYHPKEGISGNFQVQLKVYGKKGNVCPNCGTPLRKIFVNGRGTTYCPKCQKNPGIPVVFGITGPIASGKSTVAKLIEARGFTRLDCDEIVHQLYKDKNIQESIKKIIPEVKIINHDIDRVSLKYYLIENSKKKNQLEKFIHKEVISFVENEIKKSKKPIVIEAPFLFENDLYLLCDKTIYVEAKKDKQISNLKIRNDDVEKSLKLNSSYNLNNKKKATYVIINNNDIANLERQINSIFDK